MEYKINMGDLFRIERDYGINLLSEERYKPLQKILDEKNIFLREQKTFIDIMNKKQSSGLEFSEKEVDKMKSIMAQSEDLDIKYKVEEKYILAETYFAYLDLKTDEQREAMYDTLNIADLREFETCLISALEYHFKPRHIGTRNKDSNIQIDGGKKKPKDKSVLWYITYAIKNLGLSYEETLRIEPAKLIDIINQSNYLEPRKEKRAVE